MPLGPRLSEDGKTSDGLPGLFPMLEGPWARGT